MIAPRDDSADRDGRSATEDDQLLRNHLAGDPDAFAALVRRHSDRLWAVALRTLGDADEAADALQEALLSAYRHAGQFRGEAKVSTWLHRIVVNACLDRARRAATRRTVPLTEAVIDVPEPRDRLAERETADAVHAGLAALPLTQRAALVLVDVEGYPLEEAAALLEVPLGTVKSRCARGRARLAVLLGHIRTDGNPDSGAPVQPPSALRPTSTSRPTFTSRPQQGGTP